MTWTDEEHHSIYSAILAMCEIHGKRVTKAITRIYLKAFENLPANIVIAAIEKSITDSVFFPKPAEILALATGNLEEQAISAWCALLDTIRSVGPYQSIIFEDWRISHMVRSFGGWKEVCNWEESTQDFRRMEFLKAYVNLKSRIATIKHIGLVEQSNACMGYGSFCPHALLISKDGTRHPLMEIATVNIRQLPEESTSDERDESLDIKALINNLIERFGDGRH